MRLDIYLEYFTDVEPSEFDLLFTVITLFACLILGFLLFCVAKLILLTFKKKSDLIPFITAAVITLCIYLLTFISSPLSVGIKDELEDKPTITKIVDSYKLIEQDHSSNKCIIDSYVKDGRILYINTTDLGERTQTLEVSGVFIKQGDSDKAVLNVYETIYQEPELNEVFNDSYIFESDERYHDTNREYQLLLPKNCAN